MIGLNKIKLFVLDEYGVRNWSMYFILSLPIIFLMLLIAVGGVGIYLAEFGQAGATVDNKLDAGWLAVMAASTVGFGFEYPVTTVGRFIVGLIAGFGICTFNAIGTFVSLLVFGKFNTEVQNRELRKQNAEIISVNRELLERCKEIIEIDNSILKTNSEIVQTTRESIDRNAEIHRAIQVLAGNIRRA